MLLRTNTAKAIQASALKTVAVSGETAQKWPLDGEQFVPRIFFSEVGQASCGFKVKNRNGYEIVIGGNRRLI